MRGLGALRAWWRKGAPTPRAPAPPAEPRRGQGPYREGAFVPPEAEDWWPRRPSRFTGYEVLETDDGGPRGCRRQMIAVPGRGEARLSLACFDARMMDEAPSFAMRFDECRIYTRLRHPRLGRVLELGCDGDVYWHLSEYPPGITLESLLPGIRRGIQGGAPQPGLAVITALFADAAEGFHHAHTEPGDDGAPFGWWYRSLTPSAILLGEDGRGSVVDWGLEELRAGCGGGPTSSGLLKGTLARYLTPEHVKGAALDARSDVFVLGVMLYEATTGSRPFEADTDLGVLERLRRATPPAPSELVRGYPPALEALVLRALAMDPVSRLTAGDLSRGLRALTPVQPVAVPWQESTPR